jgi:hypothetical protein
VSVFTLADFFFSEALAGGEASSVVSAALGFFFGCYSAFFLDLGLGSSSSTISSSDLGSAGGSSTSSSGCWSSFELASASSSMAALERFFFERESLPSFSSSEEP